MTDTRRSRKHAKPVRWYERHRLWWRLGLEASSSGLAAGCMAAWRGDSRYSRIFWSGRRHSFLWWPRQKWECLIRRRHWPYWPDGRPVFMGLCGRCLRCTDCGTISWEHAPGCSQAEEWGYGGSETG